MTEMVLHLQKITIAGAPPSVSPARIEAVLREALAIFAEKVSQMLQTDHGDAEALAFTGFTFSDLSADDWFGPRGAERVADALMTELTSRRSS